jgi:hypothetical protein
MNVSVRNSQIKNLIRTIIVTGLMFISACSDQESWTNIPSQPPPESTVFTEINTAEPERRAAKSPDGYLAGILAAELPSPIRFLL